METTQEEAACQGPETLHGTRQQLHLPKDARRRWPTLKGDIGDDDNDRVALVAPSAFTEGGSTEITLCAEVAGLTNISQSIPPWINEKIAGMLRVKLSLYESSHPG